MTEGRILKGSFIEIAQDTPDTDTKSEHSDFELEYEIASSDEAEHPVIDDLSSESDVSRSEAVRRVIIKFKLKTNFLVLFR